MTETETVYALSKQIPKGKVTTYKALAEAAGNPKAARAVGRILNKNKNLIIIPCHRVIRSDRSVGGYAAGIEKKIKLLRKEGVEIKNEKVAERFIIRKL